MKPYRGTNFFGDGLSSRPPVEGTIARGYLRADKEFYTGKKDTGAATAGSSQTGSSGSSQTGSPGSSQTAPAGSSSPTGSPSPAPQSGVSNPYPDDVETFPFTITEDTVKRGRERYQIFCSACHGATGYGDGMIVRRGFRQAASFHEESVRRAPVGHYFDAITNGWGAMPSYSAQVPVEDRWAIIAYIRALQLSQQNVQKAQPGGTPVPGSSPQPASAPQASPASGGHD